MITIKRPIKVKMILTEQSRDKLIQEFEESLKRLNIEIEQLQFQGKKLLADAQKRGPEALKMVRERLQKEERSRKEKINEISFQMDQLRCLPLGTEIFHSTVESEAQISVGDCWDRVMKGTEIVLKDGIVYEIREGRSVQNE